MKNIGYIALILAGVVAFAFKSSSDITAEEIVNKVDHNTLNKTSISTSKMIVYGSRRERVFESKSYSKGRVDNFTEYLSPARDKGTKMLKLDDKLWIYSPSSDRTIQISGHMLRQSLMGSDLSYEDMMEEPELIKRYKPTIEGEETVNGEDCWIIKMDGLRDDLTYQSMKMWVSKKYFVPMKQDMFAKSGQLLKRVMFDDIREVNGKNVAFKMNYKDMLKEGKGTDFVVTSMEVDVEISDNIFNKANLKK